MIEIRKAQKNDAELVFDFILKLAKFEKLLDEVTATKEMIETSVFSNNSNIEVAIAEYNNEPVGFVLYFYNYSTFKGKKGLYIEDLFVDEEFRGLGIGKALLKYCADRAILMDCGRMEWSVLTWNPAVDFYKSLGAEILEEWRICRLTDFRQL